MTHITALHLDFLFEGKQNETQEFGRPDPIVMMEIGLKLLKQLGFTSYCDYETTITSNDTMCDEVAAVMKKAQMLGIGGRRNAAVTTERVKQVLQYTLSLSLQSVSKRGAILKQYRLEEMFPAHPLEPQSLDISWFKRKWGITVTQHNQYKPTSTSTVKELKHMVQQYQSFHSYTGFVHDLKHRIRMARKGRVVYDYLRDDEPIALRKHLEIADLFADARKRKAESTEEPQHKQKRLKCIEEIDNLIWTPWSEPGNKLVECA